MTILLYLMVGNYHDIQLASQRASGDIINLLTTMSLWAFLFGVLMEWNGLRKLVRGKFTLNWQLLIPTVILSVLMFIPTIYWYLWYGGTDNVYPDIFALPETHMVLSVLAGTMLVRSFVDNK
ncbi:hypothetical protein [Radiobacillus sp. PE A8.2]|uniref:hypothetical protein n=1 Tax=Radiobacillus sp. PE A8.2 TaxID=3380349 RepID=UPI00388EDE9B